MKMDKFIIKTSKRKKRRTRRNLDEIRKRTLQVHCKNSIETIYKLAKPKVTSFITDNRLTLANKAIQSETVTRSLLFHLDKEKNKNVIVLPNRGEAIDTNVVTVNYKKDAIPFKVNSILESPLCNYTGIDNHKTPDSVILFSSLESETVLNNIKINDVLSDSSSSGSLSFVMQTDNSLYSEFMTNIVNYVQECASDFLNKDTVLKANFLPNVICKFSSQTHSYEVDYENYEVKTNLPITGNDENISKYPKSLNNINIQYSLEQLLNAPSPILHHSHEINFQKCILSSSSACSGKDSPEYFYYPHRLNQ